MKTRLIPSILASLLVVIFLTSQASSPQQYQLISDSNPALLQDNVNKQIKLGWKPQGGIALTDRGATTSPRTLYLQAMVK